MIALKGLNIECGELDVGFIKNKPRKKQGEKYEIPLLFF